MLSLPTFSWTLLGLIGLVTSLRLRDALGVKVRQADRWRADFRRVSLSAMTGTLSRDGLVHFDSRSIRINDPESACVGLEDIFLRRIYHFESQRPDPVILDCGANIGLSALYFARIYPRARIMAFEPDPDVFPYLSENIARNGVTNVELIQAALSTAAGTMSLFSDGKNGSCLAVHASPQMKSLCPKHEVSCVRLRDYLTGRIDFLKMNIEGSEWDVLADSEDLLSRVDQMVIEYHHLPGLPRTLHSILSILYRQGFEVLVNNYDVTGATNSLANFGKESRYFLLIQAKRFNGKSAAHAHA